MNSDSSTRLLEALRSNAFLRPRIALKGATVCGGLNRKHWRTVRIDDVAADALELQRELVPMLRVGDHLPALSPAV